MSARAILVTYLLFFALRFFWEAALNVLNRRHLAQAAEDPPGFVHDLMDTETYRTSVRYTMARGRVSLVSNGFASLAVLAIVLGGALGWLDQTIRGWGMGPYLTGAAFFFAVFVFMGLVDLPFSVYSQFVVEQRFGFNRMTPWLFALDLLKSALVSLSLMTPLLLGLFWFMDRTGELWWIWAFVGVSVFQLVITIVYPSVIAPLFNKFTPMEDGERKERINDLAAGLGFETSGIYVMDGSRRSGHSNAYFTGLGRAKRIVLFDTLLDQLSVDELLAVLSHEIGHRQRRHIVKRLAVSMLALLAGLWVVNLLLPYEPFYEAFGLRQPSYHGILVIISFCAGPFTFFLKPLAAMWSRRHEYEADRFAVDSMEGAGPMKRALVRLASRNLSNPNPHPLYSFYHFSHPALAERVAALDTYERSRS